MSEHREQRIRELAHSLWESDGCPEGRDREYWHRAEKLIETEDDPAAPHMVNKSPL